MNSHLNADALNRLKNWFDSYCCSFSTPVEKDQRNITSKQEHTYQVCLNSVRIAEDLKLGQQEVLIAEAIGLFHDIGRFPQYRQYRTFDDSISINHAALGVKVLLENTVLKDLSKHDQDLIVHAVTLHNVFALPEGLNEETLLFARVIRDADKVDIMRVVLNYFEQDRGSRAEAVSLGLPDLPGCSEPVLAALSRGEMSRKAEIKNQNDFKLLQLAWVYDINFTSALRMIQEQGTIDRIAALLPGSEDVYRAIDRVREHVSRRVEGE